MAGINPAFKVQIASSIEQDNQIDCVASHSV
jgi:hypothetical protein